MEMALPGAPRHETGWRDSSLVPLPCHTILGHIAWHPALNEHPREFKIPHVLSWEVCFLPGAGSGMLQRD